MLFGTFGIRTINICYILNSNNRHLGHFGHLAFEQLTFGIFGIRRIDPFCPKSIKHWNDDKSEEGKWTNKSYLKSKKKKELIRAKQLYIYGKRWLLNRKTNELLFFRTFFPFFSFIKSVWWIIVAKYLDKNDCDCQFSIVELNSWLNSFN